MDKKRITIIPGDGIGYSIVTSTLKVLEHLQCGFAYDFADAGETAFLKRGEFLPQETVFLIKKNAVTLKGPLLTPIGKDLKSIDDSFRRTFDLFVNIRPVLSFRGIESKFENVDIITVRENAQSVYFAQGQNVTEGARHAESVAVIAHKGAERIAFFAFELARKNGRKKVTVVHKADLLKSSSDLFFKGVREVSREFDDIEYQELTVDNCSMQLALAPQRFDVIVTTDQIGGLIADLCSDLVGSPQLSPSANFGENVAIFEAGHGSAPDMPDRNIANPTCIMLAAAMMLDHLRMTPRANRLRQALRDVVASGERVTKDLGGTATTDEFTQAVMEKL